MKVITRREILNKRHRDWCRKNPARRKELQKRADLKRFYGLTPEQLAIEIQKRSNRCDICGNEPHGKTPRYDTTAVLHIDHKPKTKGTFRGLLCAQCNVGLGSFRDDSKLLAKAIQYLSERTT